LQHQRDPIQDLERIGQQPCIAGVAVAPKFFVDAVRWKQIEDGRFEWAGRGECYALARLKIGRLRRDIDT
jgi:hypothetical protein